MTRSELKELFQMVWSNVLDVDEAMAEFDEESGSPICDNCGEPIDGKIITPDKD